MPCQRATRSISACPDGTGAPLVVEKLCPPIVTRVRARRLGASNRSTVALVAAFGAWLVFALNAISYIGIIAVLVRWKHETLGFLQPDTFIPLAERSGLMPQLTRAVIEQAIAEVKKKKNPAA